MAMLKNKHVTFSLILFCLAVVSPMAKAQLGGLNIITITGAVFCTVNATVNGTSAPPFPGATVQLQCGPANAVVTTAITNLNGVFTILTTQPLATLLSTCRLVVTTPLASCNATLPNVNLTSTLTLVGSLITGLINLIIVVPTGFIPSVPLPLP
ncbi:Phylloplanin [Cardamine amara subsp. amara]|uniref:Phylloplanin n=1 Tax=Cardamine amara subsp. amara TaxID=228776 RepID=A0ABD0ZB40_CARAN